jgi:hypothetical protein
MAVGTCLSNAVFLTNSSIKTKAAPGSQLGNADINVGFHPGNNSFLAVHEYSGFESGDSQGLQTVRDFILYRTDASCAGSERLHAIW